MNSLSLLDELRSGGYEASLTTTFNAYLPFYEEVVLRRLINAGVRHNVLLMDQAQFAQSLSSAPPLLAGRSYTLAPMNAPGAFHPKLIVLLGKSKGLVVVGSHNMTLSGFGLNRELTNLVRVQGARDADAIALASSAWTHVRRWVEAYSDKLPDHVRAMIEKMEAFAPWLTAAVGGAGDVSLIASSPGQASLWEQLLVLVDRPVREVFVTGAFFDRSLTFLDRIQADLSPQRLVVAVEPETVQLPVSLAKQSSAIFVDAGDLGTTQSGGHRRGYLHAKAIRIVFEDGGELVASGSANPSSPAWNAPTAAANAEMMLVSTGEQARQAAQSLGLDGLDRAQRLGIEAWDIMCEPTPVDQDEPVIGVYCGVVGVDGRGVQLPDTLLKRWHEPQFRLKSAGGQTLIAPPNLTSVLGGKIATFDQDALSQAVMMEVHDAGEVRARLVLHHEARLEAASSTGPQRKFRDALASLSTEAPNIDLLVSCLNQIVFDRTDATARPAPQKRGVAGREASNQTGEVPETLEVSLEDMPSMRSRRKRMIEGGDLAYLFDALIYHLVDMPRTNYGSTDRAGRSEEEQVGADDDVDVIDDEAQLREAILRACHVRVGTVVARTKRLLGQYEAGDVDLKDLVVRLLAVLAVLRELRNCDGRVNWATDGQSTVPIKSRIDLLEALAPVVLEGSASLLRHNEMSAALRDSDEMARFKGLLLWLCWDCGLTMDLRQPFNEEPEAKRVRLSSNALILAVAQTVRGDPDVISEGRGSIERLAPSAVDWLDGVTELGERCTSARGVEMVGGPFGGPGPAKPGDVVRNRQLPDMPLSFVLEATGRQLRLAPVVADGAPRKVRSSYFELVDVGIETLAVRSS
jgi:hypothetical protein